MRFLRAAALHTAQLLNRAGQWLSVLERSGIVALLEPWFSNRTKTLVKTPKLRFHDTRLCAFLMGLGTVADLRQSPLAGSLWETLVFSEFHRLLSSGMGSWRRAFWRDRTKEADFLLHKAGRVLLADAKWAEHPDGPGRLERVRAEFRQPPPAAIVCRSPTAYPLAAGVTAQPLSGLTSWLSG
jgi:hypothetical protein